MKERMLKTIKIDQEIYKVSSDDDYLTNMGDEFEPHMVQLFRTLVEADDVVADIGANIGLTALLFSGLARKTYAFEPTPSTYRILRENLARNQCGNIEAFNFGLGMKQETLAITFAATNRSGGYVSDKIRPKDGHVTEEIRIDQLDHFFATKDPSPNFLKIDVEGFEMNVIRGGLSFLATRRPTVVMEMNHFCLDVLQRITVPDFLDFMRNVFPHLYAVDADNREIVDLHSPEDAYRVMHEHVVKQRFPNIVGAFDPSVGVKLEVLATEAKRTAELVSRRRAAPITQPTGSIALVGSMPQIVASTTVEIKVQVVNDGPETWYSEGDNPVFLCYHWCTAENEMVVYDGIRSRLADSCIVPGRISEHLMHIAPPNEEGTYRLVLTFVQEGVCWFEERGFTPAKFDVEVT
ncbi:hypothetical protein CEK68_15370 [Xanthomonas sp. LMG 12461]|nr:hypothetical protein CEK68_15370 [Xanthomonas sp. LMG 12461]